MNGLTASAEAVSECSHAKTVRINMKDLDLRHRIERQA